jgi:pimeloyl-ACP methyl ester carboxylesterase
MVFLVLVLGLLVADPPPPAAVSFPTSDAGVVGADLYGGGPHWVVLVHGGRYSKESWADQAPVLAASGLHVLAIDLRGRNASHGGPEPGSERLIHLDVLAAMEFARGHGAETISLVGASLGGWAAGEAAVESPPGSVDALVLLAATPVQEPERLQGRKLFVVAEEDRTAHGRPRLEAIRDQYRRAPEPKELVVLESDAHAQALFETELGAELVRILVEHLLGMD